MNKALPQGQGRNQPYLANLDFLNLVLFPLKAGDHGYSEVDPA